MATEFSQDAVLFFLQRQGGTVKNSDLILHFKDFIRDHPDRDRNRQFFKKFVNSVATVKQVDGVAHVTLRRQFRGYVPGSGADVGSSDPPWVPVEKKTENAALNEPRQKPEQKEAATPAPPGETGKKTILPAAGIFLNNNNVEENFNRKQQQVSSTPGQLIRPVTAQVVSHIPQKPELKTPSLSQPPAPDQDSKGGQQRVGYGPLPGVTPAPPHRETSPGPEPLRGRSQPERGLHQEAPAHPQLAVRRVKHRQSYKTAVSFEEEEDVTVMQDSAGGVRPPNAPLSDPVRVTPAPSSVQRSYIQGTEGDMSTAGISLNNNSNMAANFSLKQQQVNSTPGQLIRPVTAQVVSHIPQKPELKTPSLSTPPASDQASKLGQQRVGYGPLPGVTPAPPHRETSPGPEALRRRSQPEEGLHQEAPAHPQLIQRRAKHRQSYRSAVSFDEDEEEEFPIRRSSAGGAWPLNAPLGDTARAMSSSTPCIIDVPAPPAVPQIYIQDAEDETLTPGHAGLAGLRLGPGEATKRSLPSETALHHNIRQVHQYSRPTRELRLGSNQSHSSIYTPSSAGGFSTRASGWTGSAGDLQIRAGEPVGMPRIQETVQQTRETAPESATSRDDRKSTPPWHRSTGRLHDEQETSARSSPLQRSTDQLHEDQGSAARVMPWHLSTDDLCDRDEVETSDSSVSLHYVRHHLGVADQFGTKQMNRMCRSLGDDLDQIAQEEERGERGRGTEMARRSRLHRISSSISLHHNLSCSSLSSCSTPPRCPSLASLDEAVVQKGDKMNASTEASPSSTQRDGRSRHSLLPLESREHAWMIKGAAGNWTDIYSLFREDPSLLNKKDFISGFTVLHWIAKHGDHRVLNTLGYGAEKLSLTFDINARANSGHTPLHLAVMHGHKNIIRLLVKKYQADVKQRDVAGKRPWQYLSGEAPVEMFHVLGAPLQDVMGKKSVGSANASWEQQQKQQRESRRLRHQASSASGERPLTVVGTVKVKRSTSLAAFLKHKTLQKFHVQQVDTSV
ncbi:uncharacterized protein sowahb [Archocentrus centrarchus]|uniref:uncharacterized protein sowahb n=1 Tax=Archocentrus centrarchus TaxID=63155 RepID=UPI0011E9FF39|nr:uncharacterized protein LOC115789424 [Archocentrus centrarchus]